MRLFVNVLTPADKDSFSVKASAYTNQFKCCYLKIKTYSLNLFLHLLILHKIWNALKKKMSLESYLFLKL